MYQGFKSNLELPAGLEPTVSELQSLALPLGYGSSERDYTARPSARKGELQGGRELLLLLGFARFDSRNADVVLMTF